MFSQDHNLQILISGSYNAFKEGYNGAGVYLASGISPSNTFEFPIYVGSAVDLYKRIIGKHLPELSGNKHLNKPFQNYSSKNGVSQIIWFLLEPCKRGETLQTEQYYLDKLRPFVDEMRGFNICKFAGSSSGFKHTEEAKAKISRAKKGNSYTKGTKLSEATKSKISETKKGIKLSEGTRNKMSEARKGKRHSDETIQKMSEARKRYYAEKAKNKHLEF